MFANTLPAFLTKLTQGFQIRAMIPASKNAPPRLTRAEAMEMCPKNTSGVATKQAIAAIPSDRITINSVATSTQKTMKNVSAKSVIAKIKRKIKKMKLKKSLKSMKLLLEI